MSLQEFEILLITIYKIVRTCIQQNIYNKLYNSQKTKQKNYDDWLVLNTI